MKKLSLSILFLLVLIISYATNTLSEKVYFKKAEDVFQKSEMNPNVIKGNLFYLKGFADSEGDEEYNLDLSKRRVESVKAYLLSKGIAPQNIHTSYLGERDGESYLDMKENRVVEITYMIDPLMQHEVAVQEFFINNEEENVITGKHGTIVTIPAGAFMEENVVLNLKEYYTPLEIMSANLSTVSGGQNLETGGMVYIEAKSNNVDVTPIKDLEFSFPADKEIDDFELFTGEVSQDLEVNWVPVNQDEVIDIGETWVYNTSGTWWYGWYTFDDLRASESLFLSNAINPKLFSLYGPAINSGKYQLLIKKNGDVEIIKADFPEANESDKQGILSIINEVASSRKFKYIAENCEVVIDFDDLSGLNALDYAITSEVDEATEEPEKVTSSPNSSSMKTRTLGWINCDRFLNNRDLVDFKVKVANGVNVRMIVKEYKSYFNSSSKNGHYEFARIPKDQEVYLVAMAERDGKILLAIEDVKTSKAVFTDFNFEVYSYKEMIKKLGEIKL